MERPQAIYAGATIFTGLRVTLVQLKLAKLTQKTTSTAAVETINSVHTRSVVETGGVGAIWDIAFTVDPIKSRRALACVAVHVVRAAASVPAGGANALVQLLLTALPMETSSALAQETPHLIYTSTTITARIGAAVIDVGLAVDSTVSRLAFAAIAAHCVDTLSAVLTWVLPAFVYIICTLGSFPATEARAGVRGVILGRSTRASSLAGLRCTWDQLLLTVFPCER